MTLKDLPRLLVDLASIAIVFWTQWRIGAAILAWAAQRPPAARLFIRSLWIAVCLSMVAGFVLTYHKVVPYGPRPAIRGFLTGFTFLWAFSSTGAMLARMAWRLLLRLAQPPRFDPERRTLLNTAGNALAVAAPFALTGFGALIQRTNFQVREIDIPVPNLPRDLQGLRILQLTDIHLGPYLSERDLARVIDESGNLRPQLVVVTGDLISMRDDPLDACLHQIARLRPDSGIFGCLGNHEAYAGLESVTAERGARLGIHFLRRQARSLRFGAASLNLAGTDYESISRRKRYLTGCEKLIDPGAVNVLLSHNPDVFPVAARQGYDVTIAGHTHGGQVTVEILHQSLNIARFITPFVYGHYSLPRPSGEPSSIYVSRGIGTIGLPVRIGAPPEITLLRLTAA
ncbi:MAG TPA: metallophosphoesterase [Bryobacteraceae bacterium]|nr:metallophosphoesterase [Bryobacteraceae bacterium]